MTEENSARDDLLGRAGPDTPAQGPAVERPDGHGTGWDTIPERPDALDELRGSWRDGLARNTAAPASVLHRLLDVAPDERFQSWLIHRELPEEVIASWLAHPEWRVRKGLAERWQLDAEQRSRLLRDPDPQHRWIILTCAVDGRSALTDAAYARLADDPSPRVRAELALHGDLPVRHLTALAADPDTEVRVRGRAACLAAPGRPGPGGPPRRPRRRRAGRGRPAAPPLRTAADGRLRRAPPRQPPGTCRRELRARP